MNVKEIVSKYLTDNGYDGLFDSDGGFGCSSDDLYMCCECFENCEPMYKSPCSEKYDYYIGPNRLEKEDKNV